MVWGMGCRTSMSAPSHPFRDQHVGISLNLTDERFYGGLISKTRLILNSLSILILQEDEG